VAKSNVIIVGGGISGLYTAWRLGTATTLKVLVLEADDRFGGRYLSCKMPGGFVADLGAMRRVFLREKTTLNKLFNVIMS